MDGFHHRYMPSATANRNRAAMVRELEIDRIVPQHGAIFADAEMSAKFIDWVEHLPGDAHIVRDVSRVPA